MKLKYNELIFDVNGDVNLDDGNNVFINGNNFTREGFYANVHILNANVDPITLISKNIIFGTYPSTSPAIYPIDYMRIMFLDKNQKGLLGLQFAQSENRQHGQLLLNMGAIDPNSTEDVWRGISIIQEKDKKMWIDGITPPNDAGGEQITTAKWVRELLTRNGYTLNS